MQIEFKAAKRVEQGTGASRRLRRAGKLPGILYGADQDATPVTLDHNEIYHLLRKEAFHASILSANFDDTKETVVLRDVQWHPYKQQVLHIDFQRISATEKIHLKVPVHLLNADECPAVKLEGGMVSQVITEINVACLPKDLPEFIAIDIKDLTSDKSVHVSDLRLPAGVEIVHHGEGDPVIVTVLKTGASSADTEETTEETEE